MKFARMPGLLMATGGAIGSLIVKVVRGLFTLLAWLPLGLILRPFKKYWVVKQVPNLLSGMRLVLTTPVVIWGLYLPLINHGHHGVLVGLKMLAGLALLDAIDGPLANILDATSDIGKVLDPAADKWLMANMLIAYCLAILHKTGVIAFIPLIGVASWVLRVEVGLIAIAAETKKVLDQIRERGGNPELAGANIYGKVKFNLQMIAMFTGWWMLIQHPADSAGPIWMIAILMIARFFADKSLGHHREDVAELEEQLSFL